MIINITDNITLTFPIEIQAQGSEKVYTVNGSQKSSSMIQSGQTVKVVMFKENKINVVKEDKIESIVKTNGKLKVKLVKTFEGGKA